MLHWNRIGVPRVSPPALLALVLACAVFVVPAGANLAPPAPEEGILFHVQPVSDDFCDEASMSDCSQIHQYTSDRGVLEFDLYVYSTRESATRLTVSYLHVPLAWPDSWNLLSWDACAGAEGGLVQAAAGHKGDLTLHWSECPALNGRLFLAARFVLDAPDFGWFGMAGFPNGPVLRLADNLGETDIWWTLPGWAEAGVECSHCSQPCDLMLACKPEFSKSALRLSVISGTTGSATLGARTGLRCSPGFSTTAEWLTLDTGLPTVTTDGQSYAMTALVDATALAAGDYEAWIEGSDDCTECVRVLLTVLPPPPVDASAQSWGHIKSRFR